jgi:rod shape determining protein RodA
VYQKDPAIAKGIDGVLVSLYIALVLIGVLCIFSVEYKNGENIMQSILLLKKNYARQLLFIGMSAIVAVFLLLTDSKFFTATSNISYALGIVLMIATLFIGKNINGSKSWIALGFFNLQPVELCKIFTALALGKYLSLPETNFQKPKSQLIGAAIIFTPAFFSLLQNETGLALVYFSFLIPMYREGLPPGYLIAGATLGLLLIVTLLLPAKTLVIAFSVLAVLTIYFSRGYLKRTRGLIYIIISIWAFCCLFVGIVVPFIFKHVFQKYQADRIYSMVGKDNPFTNEKTGTISVANLKIKNDKKEKDNYNVKQSKIAIGSGGFFGKGFLKGTQTQGDFVPEQHTDFIFTSVGESFGFFGSALLMLLYLGLLLRIISVAERQRSTFSRVYAYSVAAILFFHVSINICMTIGLAPVIGITLPLMSYGGSSLLTFTILIFILIKLDADRQMVLR